MVVADLRLDVRLVCVVYMGFLALFIFCRVVFDSFVFVFVCCCFVISARLFLRFWCTAGLMFVVSVWVGLIGFMVAFKLWLLFDCFFVFL